MIIDSFSGQYRFLSNFWPAAVLARYIEDERTVPSVEHAYQAMKAQSRNDFHAICSEATPGRAKSHGKRVRLRESWDEARDGIMLELLRQKFSEPKLRELLLLTGDDELIEGNHWGDTYWGVCRGVGENRLGKLLMQVRSECAH